MKILAIDTSSESSSVALLNEETICAEFYFNTKKRYDETLLQTIEALLSQTEMRLSEIDLFVATVGPGSFTGLRVGLSTIKGFAFSAGKPIAGVSTLMALACNIPHSEKSICPMLDARRGEIYTALYRMDKGGVLTNVAGERVTRIEEFLDELCDETIFIGDGAALHADIIRKKLSERSYFVPESFNCIRAGAVGLIGLKKHLNGDILTSGEAVPRYLRRSYAGS